MKKYLMTGIAAVAMCAAFTSCSHDVEPVTQEQIDQVKAEQVFLKYEQSFISVFGQPAATQKWGFDGAAFTRSENANANEWADPTKEYGGLKVPPPLTDAQIAVVREYFQTHPNLGYEDPQWSNYFIQQVYKGYTNVPAGCATPEQYLAASGSSYIKASDHMDHLIAVDKEKGIEDHINNFNHGDCSSNSSVLTWSPDYVSSANTGPFHTDKIMYMQNSTTKSFGYHNSDGSLYHTEYTGLVSYKTIMQAMGTKANCLNDGWNRSFMGFDFEQMVGSSVYEKMLDYNVEGGWNSEKWGPDGFPVLGYKTFEFEGKTYNYLSSNTNMYAADLNETSYVQKNGSTSTTGGKANFNDRPSDAIISDLLSKGYLPYSDTLKDWVKVGGTADGYYSDWIVTLTKAEQDIHIPEGTTLRVMAEDLSANEETDYDFNDVVLDFVANDEGTAATIILQAAGGTLPLRIDRKDAWEVHKLFGVATNVMVNTNSSVGSHVDGLDPVIVGTVTGDFSAANFRQAVKDVVIEVQKDGTWMPLTANEGRACCKFGCDPNFHWVNERQPINEVYNFTEWVQGFTTTLTLKNN